MPLAITREKTIRVCDVLELTDKEYKKANMMTFRAIKKVCLAMGFRVRERKSVLKKSLNYNKNEMFLYLKKSKTSVCELHIAMDFNGVYLLTTLNDKQEKCFREQYENELMILWDGRMLIEQIFSDIRNNYLWSILDKKRWIIW